MSKKQDLPGPQAFVENLLAYTVGIDNAPKDKIDSNVEQPPQATWGSWLNKAATNAYGAVTAPIETYNNIANASSMAAALYNNPQYLPDLMNDGLLSELAKHKDKANDLFGWLTYTPVVSTMLQNLGVDKESFKIILELSSQSPEIADDLGKTLASYMGSGTPTPEKTTEFMAAITDQAIALITSDKTENKAAAVDLVQSYLLKAKNHRDALEANPGFKEINRLSLEIADPYKSLDEVNRLINQKTKLVVQHFSTMDNIAFALKDYTAIIDCLNDKKFLEAAVKNPKKLQDLTTKVIEMAYLYKDQEQINDNFKAVVLSAVSLITDDNVSKALQPLATEQLVTAIFDLPSSEAIADYRRLVTNLSKKPEKFQALLAALLKEKTLLNESLGITIDYINSPAIPKYKVYEKGKILQHLEVGLSLSENNEIVAHTNKNKAGQSIIILDKALEKRVYDQLFQEKQEQNSLEHINDTLYARAPKDLDLNFNEQLELYATTHPKAREDLDNKFNTLLIKWVDIASKEKTLPTVLALADANLTHNIFELGLTKDMMGSEKAGDALINGAGAVAQTLEIQAELSDAEKAAVGVAFNPLSEKEEKKKRLKSDTQKFSLLIGGIAGVIGKLGSENIQGAIQTNEAPLISGIDQAIKLLPSLEKALNKFEINGTKLVKIMPELCSEKGLKALEVIVKEPTATNIAKLVLTEPKILSFAMNHLMKYCKNCLLGQERSTTPTSKAEAIGSADLTPPRPRTSSIQEK